MIALFVGVVVCAVVAVAWQAWDERSAQRSLRATAQRCREERERQMGIVPSKQENARRIREHARRIVNNYYERT